MAATFWATALLMAAVCVWTSPLLSRLMTLKPYLPAFFWYIFQEKAWDGFCIWAMNASVGAPAPAPPDAAAEPPADAAGEPDVPPHAATSTAIGSSAANDDRFRCIDSPPQPLFRKGDRRSRIGPSVLARQLSLGLPPPGLARPS